MSWSAAVALAVAVALGAGAGLVAARFRERGRMQRVAEAAAELARGNLAHRVILPGTDDAALVAESLNTLADVIQRDRESAAQRYESQRRLLANVSHDLRTPITSIAGYVDALERGLGDEPERYLAVIASKTDDLAQLTDDLFYAARLDEGGVALKSRPVDLAEAVRRCVLGFEPQLKATGAQVDLEIPERARYVDGDPSAVTRILSNLVSNSLRHGEGMTRFSVEMLDRDTEYLVRVGNDGPPLPDDAEYLFERGVTGTGSGGGLGLSIARELAELMGATVTAADRPGRGVVFTLTFPRRLKFKKS